ncbi:MAG: DUF4349 domain-containing protein, partial [Kamptonema sp. SIO4C4]|nr:DUF4349 domain-containing protein [Kamptonema sp. SIO4C4]
MVNDTLSALEVIMTRLRGSRVIALSVLTALTVASCSSGSLPSGDSSGEQLATAPETAEMTEGESRSAPDAPKQAPQLVKTAEIALEVESVEETLSAISELIQQQGGDVLELQDNQPQNSFKPHTASMRLRVPQENLEGTLGELGDLGMVQSRTIQAEDVSNQLVDFSARLRNLRKTES